MDDFRQDPAEGSSAHVFQLGGSWVLVSPSGYWGGGGGWIRRWSYLRNSGSTWSMHLGRLKLVAPAVLESSEASLTSASLSIKTQERTARKLGNASPKPQNLNRTLELPPHIVGRRQVMEGFWGCRKRKRSPSAAGQGWPEPETTDKPSVVRLNVGGREYITSTSTLQKVGDSMLARMIQSSIPSATQNGAYFIDRDPDLFAYILEYLRDGAVELPSSSEPLRRLEREASFFMLPGLESLVRSRLLEVCLEVKIFAKPFGCSDEECKCGSNSLAHLNEFSDAEINAMDAEIDGYLDHPAREVRPSFQSPFATIHVVIKTQLPRNAWDAQVTVSGCPSPMTMSDLFSPAVLDLLKRCQQCWGTYVADGSLNDHPKYTNPNGAVMYWSSGKWKLNSEASTEEHVYSVDAVDDTPPRGVWCGEAGFKCMVDGVDFPRPQEASMAKAMQAIRRALVECEGLGLVHIEDVLKPVPDILRKFVEEPELSYHELHLKTGGYNVGDHYVKKEQRHHFKTCVKFEIATRSHSECKRRRADQSIRA